jgi:hypothetical protein
MPVDVVVSRELKSLRRSLRPRSASAGAAARYDRRRRSDGRGSRQRSRAPWEERLDRTRGFAGAGNRHELKHAPVFLKCGVAFVVRWDAH